MGLKKDFFLLVDGKTLITDVENSKQLQLMIYLIKVMQSSRKFNIPVQEHEYNRMYLIAEGGLFVCCFNPMMQLFLMDPLM